MKVIISFLICMFILPAYATEDGLSKKITPEIALKAIKSYRKNPVAKNAAGALSIALDFVDQSPSVTVDIKQDYFPWKLGHIDPQIESKFIGAFVAGNVEYQLINRLNKNTPLEGIKLVLYTYEKLRKANTFPADKEFEKWLIWKKKGKLSENLKI